MLPGPTFFCTVPTGREWNGHKTHLTSIALYLSVTNVGNSPTEIFDIHVGYHNYSFKYTFKWFWLTHQIVALRDFQVNIGEDVQVYPFLT
jgi:hypothetical protein